MCDGLDIARHGGIFTFTLTYLACVRVESTLVWQARIRVFLFFLFAVDVCSARRLTFDCCVSPKRFVIPAHFLCGLPNGSRRETQKRTKELRWLGLFPRGRLQTGKAKVQRLIERSMEGIPLMEE